MDKVVKKVVGIIFIKNGKLLIVQSLRSKTTDCWTLVGGGVEEGESLIAAAIREVCEEIQEDFFIEENDLSPIMCFKECAASDPNLIIEMNVFICHKEIDVALIPNEEILKFHWFKVGEVDYNLSSSIRDHFIPYAIEKGLLY
ncbi:MAG: NUDIX domain-containing protein [Firmicutes bacterium]|nr:NUDIX domain-containing protein [Bacillota bacterium]